MSYERLTFLTLLLLCLSHGGNNITHFDSIRRTSHVPLWVAWAPTVERPSNHDKNFEEKYLPENIPIIKREGAEIVTAISSKNQKKNRISNSHVQDISKCILSLYGNWRVFTSTRKIIVLGKSQFLTWFFSTSTHVKRFENSQRENFSCRQWAGAATGRNDISGWNVGRMGHTLWSA